MVEKESRFHVIPEVNAMFSSTPLLRKDSETAKKGIPVIVSCLKELPFSTLFLWQACSLVKPDNTSNKHFHKSEMINYLLNKIPTLEIVICCNDEISLQEILSINKKRLTGILCNHNCASDHEKFKIEPTTPKIWDSVYNARIELYKRHWLSYNLSNVLYLAGCGDKSTSYDEKCYKDLINKQTKQTSLITQKIKQGHLSKFLNMSQVGLCLSKTEGAMFASIEYLLCGLPIVSTKSVGGRDTFFTDENCIIADDTPESVADSVQHWLDNYPQLWRRKKIRENAMRIQKIHTKNLKNKLKQIAVLYDIDVDIDELYKKNFSNQMNWTQKIEVKS